MPPIEKEPLLIGFVEAEYPDSLLELGISGSVILDLLVNEQGNVDSAFILEGVNPATDSAVIAAVRRFKFSPAFAGGIAVPVIITYQYIITINDIKVETVDTVNFTGRVFEKGSRRRVTDAEVFLIFKDSMIDSNILLRLGEIPGQLFIDGVLMTVTDSLGKFSFKSLPKGHVSLRIIRNGYKPFEISDNIPQTNANKNTYRIERVNYGDDEILIYGHDDRREALRRSLTIGEIRKMPGFNGDALKVVQALPGVARPSFGIGSIGVRGAPTWDSRFFIDGIPVPQLYHFGGIKSTYNSEALNSVDFYPGGFGSRFGNSVAGVVEVKGRDAQRERVKWLADLNLFDAMVLVEGPLGDRGGVIASVRRSYIGDLLGFVVNNYASLDFPVLVAPYYYDYVVRADLDITAAQKLFITLFGSKDALELIVPFIGEGKTEIDDVADRVSSMTAFNMIMSGYTLKINNKVENQLRAAIIQGEGYGSLFGYAKWEYNVWEYLLRDEVSYQLSTLVKITAGIDLWWQQYWQRSVFPTTERTYMKDTMRVNFGLIAPYVEAEYCPVPSLTVTPGLRYDYYNELQYNGSIIPEFWNYRSFDNSRGPAGEPSLRILARYELTPSHVFKAAVGSYNQTPQPMGLVTHDSLGDPFTPATKSRQMSFGYFWQISDILSFDFQLYHNNQWDIPELATAEDLLQNPESRYFNADGKGRMYGLEFFLRHNQNDRWFGWISYSLSRSERYSQKEKRYVPYEKDQTHNLQLLFSCQLPKQYQVGSRIRYVTGNPYSPVVDRVYDATNRYYRPVYGIENSARNEPFFQVDLRIDKLFVFDSWKLSTYFDLQNIFWFMYKSPESTMYNFDYTEKTTISFPFYPTLGVRIEF
jgi:TonB family protein